MTTIDAAIIKALVEHVGGDTWTTMEQSTNYVPTLIEADGKTYIGLEKKTDALVDLFASRLYFEDAYGIAYRLVLVEHTSDNMKFIGEESFNGENRFRYELNVPKVEIEGREYYMKTDWTTDAYKFETMRFSEKVYENYSDPIVQKTLLRYCTSKLAT